VRNIEVIVGFSRNKYTFADKIMLALISL